MLSICHFILSGVLFFLGFLRLTGTAFSEKKESFPGVNLMTVTETETGHYSPLKTNKVEIIQNEYYFTNRVTESYKNRRKQKNLRANTEGRHFFFFICE